METSKGIVNAYIVHGALTIDGVNWLVFSVPINGYAEFEAMPKAMEYQGRFYGLSGWNSDTGRVHYSSKVLKMI